MSAQKYAAEPLLEVKNLSITFSQNEAFFRKSTLQVITDLHLDLYAGEVLAVVGSSGAGKSLLAHAILGILPENAAVNGHLFYERQALTAARQEELRGREIALIPQSVSYLNPLMRVGPQVLSGVRGERAKNHFKLKQVFRRYQLGEHVENMFPFQLSGGMARRVLLATAVMSEAKFMIADEPTSGLHPSAVKEALAHMRALADEGRGVMLITHDIGTALEVADRVAIMYAGTTVEIAAAGDFAGDGAKLKHPYSRALWRALPQNDFAPIPGSQPAPGAMLSGCAFAPRCPLAQKMCEAHSPEVKRVGDGMVRCCLADTSS